MWVPILLTIVVVVLLAIVAASLLVTGQPGEMEQIQEAAEKPEPAWMADDAPKT